MAKEKGVLATKREDLFYTSEEIMSILGIGKTSACNMIKTLREELIEQGVITENFPRGKVPKKYFNKRCGIDLSKIGL